MTAKQGSLISVALIDKKISKLTVNPVGNLDGIQMFQKSNFLISDWITGDIYYVDEKFHFQKILDLEQSVGDIAFIEDKGLLLIPFAKQGKVVAYKLKN